MVRKMVFIIIRNYVIRCFIINTDNEDVKAIMADKYFVHKILRLPEALTIDIL